MNEGIAANVLDRRDNEEGEMKEVQKSEKIVEMWKHLDENLEMKAKSFNLTAINVKSILHHMIKNPHMISVIMGLEKNCAIADLKLTRSKTKHLYTQEAHFGLREKDIVTVSRASRTFLDVDYDSNEDDDDYIPDQDEDVSEGEIENEAGAMEISFEVLNKALQVVDDDDDDVAPALHTRSKLESSGFPENIPNFSDDVLLYTTVDDPEYVEFISNLNDPSKYDFDETEDPEYNFLSDADAQDIIEEYEVRQDRTTEIPLREVENLLQDLLEARLLPSPEHLEQAIDVVKDGDKSYQLGRQGDHKVNMRRNKTGLTCSSPENIEPTIVFVDASQDDFRKVSATSSSLLGASVENSPVFSFHELQQLIAQLEKHVQLLTQFAVGCYFNKAMVKTYNAFQIMINELNDYCLGRPEHSLFNVANLEDCIATCHDAIECESINGFIFANKQKSKKLQFPLPETMFVLSRSRALLFPELISEVRMEVFSAFYPCFIREEECLLALGLFQFSHLKQFSGKHRRYALISQHLLANKTQSQIRLHLKNFRHSNQPVHTLFSKAETGTVNMIFPLENGSSAISGPPYLWPQCFQPVWLKGLVDRQHGDLGRENITLDGLTFVKITDEKNSASVICLYIAKSIHEWNCVPCCNHYRSLMSSALHASPAGRLDSYCNSFSRIFDKDETCMSIVSNIGSSSAEHALKSVAISGPSNTASTDSENTERDGIPSSAVRNLLLFASTPVCEVMSSVSPPTLSHSKMIPPANRELLAASSQCSSFTPSTSGSADVVGNISAMKSVRFAPFKKMPSSGVVDMNEYEETVSDGYEVEMISETDRSMESSISDEEFVVSSLSNLKCNNGSSLHLATDANFDFSWSVEAQTQHENAVDCRVSPCSSVTFEKTKLMSNTSNGNIEYSDPVSSPMMFGTQNKAIQCDLTAFNNQDAVTRTLEYGENNKEAMKTQANHIRMLELKSVHCSNDQFARDDEDNGAQEEQNERTVSNNGGQNNESVRNEQQSPTDGTDGGKLPGDRERDGSDGEGNEPIDEDKRRRRGRTRKDRVRDGLHGMLDARHRALQIKCMAHVIFTDFEQRMFMYQDKVRAICELISKGSMCAEMFERMHDIFEEEHEPIYFLLSFLFPQNLLPASVLENPIRKAYGVALEMIYNIEAFTSFGNTRLSARTIFRNIRDLGLDCTCEALAARLSDLIGNKGPLWEIISQNIPTRICQSNYSIMDFEYADLCGWRKVDAPFESIDLTTAIGAQTEKQRSGVFVGFLRNLFTEKKGKLYEVVAECKQTKFTSPATLRRQNSTRKPKKRQCKTPDKVEFANSSKTTIFHEITASQFIRKRSIPPIEEAEMKRKRNTCEEVLTEQSNTFTGNDSIGFVKVNHIVDSGGNMDGDSARGTGILVENTAESKILKDKIVTGPLLYPAVVKPTRKWTIEEDRKILHIYKQKGSDLDLTLASAQLELPEIPVDEVGQRLAFLLSILEHMESTSSK